MENDLIPVERIENKIYFIRGRKVMLDRDLAELYGVTTGALNQAVRRNQRRFPIDFMFQMSDIELKNWISQFVISNSDRMGWRKPPLVFTEQGVAMLSTVLKSDRAIDVNIQIMRTFTRLRKMLAENDYLCRKVEAMELQYDKNFKVVFDAIRSILTEPEQAQDEIGFKAR